MFLLLYFNSMECPPSRKYLSSFAKPSCHMIELPALLWSNLCGLVNLNILIMADNKMHLLTSSTKPKGKPSTSEMFPAMLQHSRLAMWAAWGA